jgi:hypothetical protein
VECAGDDVWEDEVLDSEGVRVRGLALLRRATFLYFSKGEGCIDGLVELIGWEIHDKLWAPMSDSRRNHNSSLAFPRG